MQVLNEWLVAATYVSLGIFYIVTACRGLFTLARIFAGASLQEQPRYGWSLWTFGVAATAVIVTFAMWYFDPGQDPRVAAPAPAIPAMGFVLVYSLLMVSPHAMLAIEFRRFQPTGCVQRHIAFWVILIAFFSLPGAMIVTTSVASYFYVNATGDGDIIVTFFDVHPVFTDSSMYDMETFWIDRSFQAALLGIPELFGVSLAGVEAKTGNNVMAVLVVFNKIVLSYMSIYMVFSDSINSWLERRFSIMNPRSHLNGGGVDGQVEI